MTDFVDAYAVLGVDPDCDQATLKAAHRRLVRRHHPDLVPPSERPAATRRLQRINVAYALVRDPAQRARYDRLRHLHRRAERAAGLDADAAAQWEAMAAAAGRWAGRWWQRHRPPPLQALARGLGRATGTVARELRRSQR